MRSRRTPDIEPIIPLPLEREAHIRRLREQYLAGKLDLSVSTEDPAIDRLLGDLFELPTPSPGQRR